MTTKQERIVTLVNTAVYPIEDFILAKLIYGDAGDHSLAKINNWGCELSGRRTSKTREKLINRHKDAAGRWIYYKM